MIEGLYDWGRIMEALKNKHHFSSTLQEGTGSQRKTKEGKLLKKELVRKRGNDVII